MVAFGTRSWYLREDHVPCSAFYTLLLGMIYTPLVCAPRTVRDYAQRGSRTVCRPRACLAEWERERWSRDIPYYCILYNKYNVLQMTHFKSFHRQCLRAPSSALCEVKQLMFVCLHIILSDFKLGCMLTIADLQALRCELAMFRAQPHTTFSSF